MEVTSIFSPFRYVFLFIVLVLVQVLICNNILLFGVAIPFIFIYFILALPLNINLNVLMALSFALGLMVDLFSDSLGLNCLACLLLSVLRKPMFYAYVPKEDKYLQAVPSMSSMGWWAYLKFALSMSAIFCFLVFSIELFSFASFERILVMASSSTLFTLLLIIASDALFNKD